jgi:hypothetical protein
MKWSYRSEAQSAAARLTDLRSRISPAQQLIALALSLALCTVGVLAVSGRLNLAPAPTAQPSVLPSAQPSAQPSALPAILLAASAAALTPTGVRAAPSAVSAATTLPQAAKFNCGTGTAETRYVADRSGAIVFDRLDASATALGTLPYRNSVQAYGTVTGRLTGNSDKWYAVRYGDRCAYIWEDPAASRLSTTRPP